MVGHLGRGVGSGQNRWDLSRAGLQQAVGHIADQQVAADVLAQRSIKTGSFRLRRKSCGG